MYDTQGKDMKYNRYFEILKYRSEAFVHQIQLSSKYTHTCTHTHIHTLIHTHTHTHTHTHKSKKFLKEKNTPIKGSYFPTLQNRNHETAYLSRTLYVTFKTKT
jgi:hypothetical protein